MCNVNVISVFNNRELFLQMKRSVEETTSDSISYRVIGIDNTTNRFCSAASAYNYAIDTLTDGEVLIFCHQDVLFKGDVLEKAYRLCINQPCRLIGAAGRKNQWKSVCISRIKDPHRQYNTLHQEVEPVFTLDELMVAGNASLFSELRFNSELCNSWHFYCAELCLRCQLKKYEVLVFDADMEHLSGGNIDASFRESEAKIKAAYKDTFRVITTTCTRIYTHKIDEMIWALPHRAFALLCGVYRKTGRPVVHTIKGKIRKDL